MRAQHAVFGQRAWAGAGAGAGADGARRGKSGKVGQSILSRVDSTTTGVERADLGAL